MSVRATYVYRNGRLVEKHLAGPKYAADPAPMVMPDLQEYRAAAADKHTGKRPMIGGRRQHREFLRNNGYTEVGNEYVPPRREELPRTERVADILRALEQKR